MRFHHLALAVLLASQGVEAFIPFNQIDGRFRRRRRQHQTKRPEVQSGNDHDVVILPAVRPGIGDDDDHDHDDDDEMLRQQQQQAIYEAQYQLQQQIADAEAARRQVLDDIDNAERRRALLERETLLRSQAAAAEASMMNSNNNQNQPQQQSRGNRNAVANVLSGIGNMFKQQQQKMEDAKKIKELERHANNRQSERRSKQGNIAMVSQDLAMGRS